MPVQRMKPGSGTAGLRSWTPLLFLIAVLATGCRTGAPLPPADFSAPGWRVQQGQAVWKPRSNRPELAGELLLATNSNGSMLVQFTKDPFPLVTAQTTAESWQISFAAGRRSWRRQGKPPGLFLWFQLPAAMRGEKPKGPWTFSRGADLWRLENPSNGEWLEGGFFQ